MRLNLIASVFGVLALAASAAAQDQSGELNRLHGDLRLSPAQEGAWRDYVAAITPTSEAMDRQRSMDQMLPQLPTPRRIALIEASMARDAADFHREGLAVIAFYQQLTPQQQRTFDAETLPPAQAQGSGQPPAR
jgi:hypothetical protein